MQKMDFSKLTTDSLIDYIFASENLKYPKIKEGAYLNRETVAFREKTNELLILQPLTVGEDMSFYLWIIDLSFSLEFSDKKITQQHFENLKGKYLRKLQLEFVSASTKKEKVTFKPSSSCSDLPFDFILNPKEDVIAFKSQNRVFIAKINDSKDKNQQKILQAEEIKLENPSKAPIDSLKWHPESPVCLGILFENKFFIYDISSNLDTNEFYLSLKKPITPSGHGNDEAKNDEKISFIDFNFCTLDNFEDFRFLAAFFMTTTGDIYYYCPIILPKLHIKYADLAQKMESIDKTVKEEAKEYFADLFHAFKEVTEPDEDQLVFRTVKNTKYEELSTKNSIQGPISKVDGGTDKSRRRRNDYVCFYRFSDRKGHIFVTVRRSGKLAFLFSLNHVMPHFKPTKSSWISEVPFKFAVIGKFQLPTYLPSPPIEVRHQLKDALNEYNFLRENTKIKFLPMKDDEFTKVMLSYYNRIYMFHLEWADIIQKNLDSKPSRILRREDLKTNCELIFDSEAEQIDNKFSNFKVDKFKPFLYGYYGFTLARGSLFVINTNGDICDYSFLRVMTIFELRRMKEGNVLDQPSFERYSEERENLKKLFQENEMNRKAFEEMIQTRLALPLGKEIPENLEATLKNLNTIEAHLFEVYQKKKMIENSFAEQIEILRHVRQKQKDSFKRIQTKVEELRNKREIIEGTFERLTDRNEYLRTRINGLMKKMQNVVPPKSEADLKAREILDELERKRKESKTKLENLKQEFKDKKKEIEEKKAKKLNDIELQPILPHDQEIFEEFKKRCMATKKDLSAFQEKLDSFSSHIDKPTNKDLNKNKRG